MEKYLSGHQYVTSMPCSSSFNCGMEYKAIYVKVENLESKVERLEKENKKIRDYYDEATKLIQLHRYFLIILPIVEFIIVGIVSYYFNKSNGLAYGIMGFLGISIFVNGFVLPKQIKELSDKVKDLEKKDEVCGRS